LLNFKPNYLHNRLPRFAYEITRMKHCLREGIYLPVSMNYICALGQAESILASGCSEPVWWRAIKLDEDHTQRNGCLSLHRDQWCAAHGQQKDHRRCRMWVCSKHSAHYYRLYVTNMRCIYSWWMACTVSDTRDTMWRNDHNFMLLYARYSAINA